MKKDFWKSDWFTGLAISLALIIISLGTQWNDRLENAAYDAAVRATSATPSPDIAIIAIDDQSIANIGRWPWPRDVQGKLINILAQAKPKAIGYTLFLSEQQQDGGLNYINQLTSLYASSAFRSSTDPTLQQEAAQFEAILKAADEKLNADRWLAASFANAGNVFLASNVDPGESKDKLPPFLNRSEISLIQYKPDSDPADQLHFSAARMLLPLPEFANVAAGIGFLNQDIASDGVVRSFPLIVNYGGSVLPSMPLLLTAHALGSDAKSLHVHAQVEVRIGKRSLAIDEGSRYWPQYYQSSNGNPPFPIDSFYDVLAGKIQPGKYQNKIVLIGSTAKGLGDNLTTPVSNDMSPVVVLAHQLSSVLKGEFFSAPAWAPVVKYAAYLLIALYLILLLPRLRAAPAAGITLALALLLIGAHFYLMTQQRLWIQLTLPIALLLLGHAALYLILLLPRLHAAPAAGITLALALLLIGAHFYLMTQQRLWIQLTLPIALLLLGHAALTTKRFFMAEKGKLKSESESAESNKMLGLAFQGQGQLDMAFDKFRKVPLDDAMMDVIYNLALDFERKRQFNKAHAAFQYMAGYKPDFRDLQERLKRAKAMEETVLIGAGNAGGTLILQDGSVEKPMLGRYQVEKELGKGAMGVVYQGRDPKIGRVVAIKTMALSNEFDASELEEVRSRFFREAETAGRLSHPHIVTIFDAGEEHDLAYIAMEFLKGRDLTPYTKPGQLLPLAKSMKIVAKVADALNYAHAQHVVHRDIKPANIMYEPENGEIKVTDFGIARITDASRTRTGMVLGTPAFMSPEQLAGKKIDGRSDIFSLGSTFYQLVTGQLPFKGESMAELMHQIVNEQPKSVAALVPNMPHCVSHIINKMMAKSPDDRYQTGNEVARALVACGKDIAANLSKAK